MTLEKGQRLGPYEIEKPLGAGGMGEVYRARDTRLDRTVAIKVLPERTAMNADLRTRFEREAKAISSLNHPNICTLHDVGHHEGTDFLVMEYLEGEVLSERLKRSAMDVEEGLDIAIQIADALTTAHGQGLIHRDLKPDNIFLTKDGAKLLDFGLAKLQISDGVIEGMTGVTQTSPLTGKGAIVGTLYYMSPEQLEGKEADARSDIFALGATLFEMITGQRAFEGQSQASLIAAVIERTPPPISEVKPLAPPGLVRLVKKCLEKDPDRRWQSARDLADELRWIAQSGSQAGVPAPVSSRRRFHLRVSWSLFTLAGVVAVLFAALYLSVEKPTCNSTRFSIMPEQQLTRIEWPRISPDGQLLAFLGTDSVNTRSIWIRPLNSLDPYRLAGTEDAGRSFWSPDSRYLAFFVQQRQLKKIAVAGGPTQLICEYEGVDGSWGSDGTILFDYMFDNPIMRVPAAGGSPASGTTLDENGGEAYHMWPWCLSDGKHFLYLAAVDTTGRGAMVSGDQGYLLKAGSLDGGIDKQLLRVHSRVEFCAPAYIIHCRDGVLFAQRLDIDNMAIVGEPIPIAENVELGTDAYQFSVSNEGTLVYMSQSDTGNSQIIAVDRDGNILDTVIVTGQYNDLALSPDGRRLAFVKTEPRESQRDVWIHYLDRGLSSRLTFADADDWRPVWSPDGERIAFASNRTGNVGIHERSASGTGDSRLIHSQGGVSVPTDWSRDGRFLSILQFRNNYDIYFIDMVDSTDPQPVLTTPHNEQYGTFSPDGRYLAYQSDESGRPEVYVRELGEAGGKWQMSADGGFTPQWRADGKELYFWNANDYLVAVPVQPDGRAFETGRPQSLFQRVVNASPGSGRRYYDVTAAGDLFYLNVPVDVAEQSQFIVVLNWDSELEK
ncbi:MAG: protein kinase [bacterium]